MALKVIGAGLGRTGTLSLKLALEHLGFGPCYHMLEVMSAPETRLPQWIQVVRGNPDWDAIFDGFQSSVDYPTCTYWREQAKQFPDAKVVLSTRDPESWFNSVHSTILSPESVAGLKEGPLAEFMEGAIFRSFGDGINDRDFMVNYFRNWEASVIAALPPERLLVHRSADGWEPLCAFLGVPIPDQPYPRVNSTEDLSTFGGVARVADDPAAGARGYMAAMQEKAFGGQ
jgi:hypothetical protein